MSSIDKKPNAPISYIKVNGKEIPMEAFRDMLKHYVNDEINLTEMIKTLHSAKDLK